MRPWQRLCDGLLWAFVVFNSVAVVFDLVGRHYTLAALNGATAVLCAFSASQRWK